MDKKNDAQSQLVKGSVEYGGFWIRLAAYVYDVILLIIINIVLSIFTGALGLQNINNMVGFVVGIAYLVGFWAYKDGQTPGKMLLKLKVVPVEGQVITVVKALIRYVGYIVSSLPILLGFIWIAFDKKKQGFHDKIAGTHVVKVGKANGFLVGFGVFLGIILPILAVVAIIAGIVIMGAALSSDGGPNIFEALKNSKARDMIMISTQCGSECKNVESEMEKKACMSSCMQKGMEEKGVTPQDMQKILLESGLMETEQEQQLQELDMQMDNLDVDMQQFEQELQKEIEGFEGMDNTENMEN